MSLDETFDLTAGMYCGFLKHKGGIAGGLVRAAHAMPHAIINVHRKRPAFIDDNGSKIQFD